MNLLLLKLTLIPTIVALVTLAIRKWGGKIGGLIGSMPWVAGAILLFFILEQGKAFGIQSIQGSMTGIMALITFCLSYAIFARKFTWLPTLLIAYVLYTLTAVVFDYLRLNLMLSYVLVLSYVVLTLYLFPSPTAPPADGRRLPFDIPIRMGVATLFVLIITGLAHVLGPNWSGILTPFPILTSVLAIFSHTLQGSNAAIVTLRGLVMGLLGFTTFLYLQAHWLPEFSVATSFGMAVVINAFINVVVGKIW
ncbi:hypothetical protein IC229_16220 [Spirosoma sp. BT702]|uniref:Uncharacterized protein n=1 Tax=Spirosoma profusum TaxID=2771354 RepID=A0A926XWP0_9BACT|nr:hypothetical protein [Spirosoma profusum]MBD2702199.1 hypothetical protein [Spirosoma profusum]